MSNPCGFLMRNMVKRLERKGLDFRPEYAFGLTKTEEQDWEPVYQWLRDCKIEHFTYTPFSTDWRRYFGFKSKADAALFKLKFAP